MENTVEEIVGQDDDECKIFVSRIPTAFDEAPVKRLIEEQLGEGSVVEVALVYAREENDQSTNDEEQKKSDQSNQETSKKEEHRGFAFVTLDSTQHQQEALALGTVRGGLKATSTKKHTLYLRPVVRSDDDQEQQSEQVCFLWTAFRCPYGNECKFAHFGEGGCLPAKNDDEPSRKRKKCFRFGKGKCKLGEKCPFSHDVTTTTTTTPKNQKADNEKDCINWKTKGKCRKGDSCPYRHDPQLYEKALKKRQHSPKERQPLSIRVFGLNYDTTAEDVRCYFGHCGPIVELTFPTFEDSGRSKGYCGILFQSPKAVSKAMELDGKELHGRWLQVQAGKMYLKQWEERHEQQHESRKRATPKNDHDTPVGEFGQKIKKRKQHGHSS